MLPQSSRLVWACEGPRNETWRRAPLADMQESMSVRCVALVLAGLSILDASASGQQPSPAPAATPTVVAAIPAAAILQRAEETVERLRGLGMTEADNRNLRDIREALPASAAEIEAVSRQSRALSVSGLTFSELLDWKRRWTRLQERLSAWGAIVQRRAAVLDSEIAEVQQLDQAWTLTRASASKEGIPDALQQQIATVLKQIADVGSALRAARSQALEVQAAIVRQSLAVSNELADLQRRETQLRDQLLVNDTEPLWEAIATMTREGGAGAMLRATSARALDDLREYVRDRPSEVALQAAVLAVLLGLAFRVRAWTPAVEPAEERAVGKLRQRPFSAAVVMMMIGTTLIRADAPVSVRAVIRVITTVPLLRLLQIGAFAELPGALVGLALLVVVSAFNALMPRAPALARIFELGECLLFIGWLLWVLGSQRLARLHLSERGRRAARVGGRIAVLLLATAVIANVFGNVVLATLLMSGTYVAVIGALSVQVAAEILDALFDVFVDSPLGRSMRTFQRHETLVRARFRMLVRLLLLGLWIAGTLMGFAMLPPAIAAVQAILGARLTVGSLSIALGDVFALGVTIWLSFAIARFVRHLLEEEILSRLALPRGMPGAISVSVSYTIILLGFFAALSAAGLDLSRLTVLLGAFGVGLSFGLQTIVNNFVSGLILVFERPIQVGDTIEVDGMSGIVRNIGIRATTLRTADGAEVIVPNGTVLSAKVINWTFSSRERRIEVKVRVSRRADPRRVIDVLLATAKEQAGVNPDPAPEALFLGLAGTHLEFSLTAWARHAGAGPRLRSDLNLAVAGALREAGLAPVSPAAPAAERRPAAR